jgi:hypothetical protein
MAAETSVVAVQEPGLGVPNVSLAEFFAAQGAVCVVARRSVVDQDEPKHD